MPVSSLEVLATAGLLTLLEYVPIREADLMDAITTPTQAEPLGHQRRWLLGVDPVFEGGRVGKRARSWDVEDELVAVAFLGSVTIDLSRTRSLPAHVAISAYAVFRDVHVIVAAGTHVELSGGVLHGDLSNQVPAVPEALRDRVITVTGHAVLGDVTVRNDRPSD
jgi:hypothetical protein